MIPALLALIFYAPVDTLDVQPMPNRWGYERVIQARYKPIRWEVGYRYVDRMPVRWARSYGEAVRYRVWWDFDNDGDVQLDDFVIFGREYYRPWTLADLVRLGSIYGGPSDRRTP